ncbi:MAG: hypothetical protein ABMA25_22730, partial [Ilumatobacteraceae bacterium]
MSQQLDQCPKCGFGLVGEIGMVRWCRRCNWNVDPTAAALAERLSAHGVIGRKEASNIRRAERLYEQYLTSPPIRPADRRALWLTFLLILPFLVLHLALVAVAVFAFVVTTSWSWRLIACVPLLVLASLPWLLTVRRRSGHVLRRAEHPALYAGVDELARDMGVAPPAHIRLDVSWLMTVDYRLGTWNLGLGVPLWMSLSPPERAAVVANRIEAARHYRSVGGIVRRSADMFENAYNVGGRLDTWLREPKQVSLWSPFRLPFSAFLRAKARVMFDTNLRLAYWCDRRAAEATSTDAMAGCLVVMHSGGLRAASRLQRSGDAPDGLGAVLRSLAEPLPRPERE